MARTPKPWLRSRDQCWYVNLDGRRIKLSDNKKDAHDLFHQIMAERAGRSVSRQLEFHTVEDIFEAFLEWCETNRKKSTYDGYVTFLSSFAKKHGSFSALSITPNHLVQWAKGSRGKQVAVKAAYSWAEKTGMIEKNPVRGLQIPASKRREVVIELDDFKRILKATPNRQFRRLLRFCWEVGCRPQEAVMINIKDFDRKNSRVIFRVKDSKGNRSARVVYLTRKAVKMLDRGPFLNTRGVPWTSNAVQQTFKRMEKSLGFKFRLYDWRHSFVTRKLKAGVDPVTLATLVGHSSTNMIAKVYAHLSGDPEFLRKQLEKE